MQYPTSQTKPQPRRRRRVGPHSQDASLRHEIELVRPDALHAYQRNARMHPAPQISQLKSSIESFGFMNPVLVDASNVVVAGHGRLQAARELGLALVPVIRVGHLSEAEIKAYRLADNKIAENSAWDEDLLRIELEELIEIGATELLSFDMHALGFETPELDILLSNEAADETEHLVAPSEGPVVARPGDLWQLGAHRIYCGSALAPNAYEAVLGTDMAQLLLTDPPYNVPISGHVRGSKTHREFAMASGEMSASEFTDFLSSALACAVRACAPGAVVMAFMDWRHLRELGEATEANDLEQLNLCVWVKNNGGMGSLYRSQHELCVVYKRRGARHINHVQLGKYGRNRTNVWSYAGVNSFGAQREADLADHPTVKPVAMLEDAIRDVTDRGAIVLDPFGGSGSTLLAAERCGRAARLIEIDPAYVDVTIRRWQALTGEQAVEAMSGVEWSERAAEVMSSEGGGLADV